jgi:hypothetical protein
MTETEWLACTDPMQMLEFLRGKVSERKLRLFAAAGFRRLVGLLPDPRQRRGIEVLELLAEGAVTRFECRGVAVEVRHGIPLDDRVAGTMPTDDPYHAALMLYREFCSSSVAIHAVHAAGSLADGAGEQREQVRLMGCIFGNPFRRVTVSREWQTPQVMALAQAAHDDRILPAGTLDTTRLAVLADALEEAGCTGADILSHCRNAGPHVRGCWVIDLLLGKQ